MTDHELIETISKHVEQYGIKAMGDYGNGYHREIIYRVGAEMFEVYDHDAWVSSHSSAGEAVDSYNQIQPR